MSVRHTVAERLAVVSYVPLDEPKLMTPAAAATVTLAAPATVKAPLHIQQYAWEHGVSADGCLTMADVKARVEMMRNIARGYQSRAIVIPHYSTTSFTYIEQERRKAWRSHYSKNGHAKR